MPDPSQPLLQEGVVRNGRRKALLLLALLVGVGFAVYGSARQHRLVQKPATTMMWQGLAGSRGTGARIMASQPGNFKRVVVTGGNKGIGAAICKKLLTDYEDTYVLLGARNPARGKTAMEEILSAVPSCSGRIEVLPLDVTDDASVREAAETLGEKFGKESSLYGVINNAGIMRDSVKESLQTNIYGVRRCCENFIPLLDPAAGRIVNIASASGPMFVARCSSDQQKFFTNLDVSWTELKAVMDEYEKNPGRVEAYGLSKACVNTYTAWLAKTHSNLKINSCTPGYILTDMTRDMGATNAPEKGTRAPLFCLFGELEGNGRYYGSDSVRSPLNRYRGPGDPPYVGPDEA